MFESTKFSYVKKPGTRSENRDVFITADAENFFEGLDSKYLDGKELEALRRYSEDLTKVTEELFPTERNLTYPKLLKMLETKKDILMDPKFARLNLVLGEFDKFKPLFKKCYRRFSKAKVIVDNTST